jgi:hypothetical protein
MTIEGGTAKKFNNLVFPGIFAVFARFFTLQTALIRLDFPTLDVPKKATSAHICSGIKRPSATLKRKDAGPLAGIKISLGRSTNYSSSGIIISNYLDFALFGVTKASVFRYLATPNGIARCDNRIIRI